MNPASDHEPLRVYLDIDGTILYEPGDGTARAELDFQLVCDGLAEFLEFAVASCAPRWLSYRTRLGTLRALEERLLPHLPAIARRIPAAHWSGFKHEAIDPTCRFVWFEDDVEPEDLEWLEAQGCLDSLVRLDPANRHNPSLMLRELKARVARPRPHSSR